MAGDNLRHRRLSLAVRLRARGPVSRGASGWLATTSGTGGCRWPSGCVRADLSQEEPADGWRQPPAPEAVPSQWVWPPGVRADLSQEEPADGWRQPPAPEVVAGRPVACARTCLKRSQPAEIHPGSPNSEPEALLRNIV